MRAGLAECLGVATAAAGGAAPNAKVCAAGGRAYCSHKPPKHSAKPARKHHLVKIGQAPVKMAAAKALLLLQPSAVLVNLRQDNAAPRGDASITICSARWARQAVHFAWTESMRRIIEGAQSQFCTARNYYGKRCRQTRKKNQIMRLAAACEACLLYTSPSPRDGLLSRMPSSA